MINYVLIMSSDNLRFLSKKSIYRILNYKEIDIYLLILENLIYYYMLYISK